MISALPILLLYNLIFFPSSVKVNFSTVTNDISSKLKTDNANKHGQAQDIAFKAITDYVIKCEEDGSVKKAAYEHFSNALRTMNHISHEENLEIVKAHIALENRGFVFS